MTKRKKADGKIDIRAALEAPVKLKQGGEAKSMPPYEATLRQHVKEALVDQSLPLIRFVIGEAEKHAVIERPKTKEEGGVFVVPKWLPDEAQREIFDYAPPEGERDNMRRTFAIVRRWIKILKEKVKGNEQK